MLKSPVTFICIAFLGAEMLLLTYLGEMGTAQTIVGGFLGLAFPAIYSKNSTQYTPENSSTGIIKEEEIKK